MMAASKQSDNDCMREFVRPLKYLGDRMNERTYLYFLVLSVPLSFCVLKVFEFNFPEVHAYKYIAGYFTYLWPLLSRNYLALTHTVSPQEGGRYVIFMAISIIMNIAVLVYLFWLFLRGRECIRGPSIKEFVALFVCIPAVSYGIFDDVIKEGSSPVWDFYIDEYGLFYFRETIILFSVYFVFTAVGILFLSLVLCRGRN